MRRLCISSIVWVWVLVATLLDAKSAIFYYGKDIAWPHVGAYDYIVVEPECIATDTHGFRTYASRVYAYVSIGEFDTAKIPSSHRRSAWRLGENKTWNSAVADVSDPSYRRYLLKHIDTLYRKGFRNFFFDTLDSYMLCCRTEKTRKSQQDGLVALIQAVHRRYPDAKLILNRGFEIFDRVRDAVEAVAFESYYRGLDASLRYKAMSDNDRAWLDSKLAPIQKAGKPIIAIDYLPQPWGKQARKLAKRLEEKGFIPYVAEKSLMRYGTSSIDVVKREVLVLYDDIRHDGLPYTSAHLYVSMPLEYLGYVPVLRSIDTIDWSRDVFDRYAAIVVWTEKGLDDPRAFYRWVLRQAKHGVKTLFIGNFGTIKGYRALRLLGIDTHKAHVSSRQCRIEAKAAMMDYETPIAVQPDDRLYRPQHADALLRYRCGRAMTTLAAATPWGGYAINEGAMVELRGENLWTVDPFALLRKTLGLGMAVVPDVTTENGRRLLFTHIDGDGSMNRAEFDPNSLSVEVIYRRILQRYRIPHSVSFVGAEILPNGLYPKLSPRLIEVAKKIYALGYVEPATHTFSHPFEWEKITPQGDLDSKYRLKVPGYRFDLNYELNGTLAIFERKLAPSGTRTPHMIFWSGDCLPPKSVLAYAYRHRMLNINGGDTTITNDKPWLSLIAPLGIKKGAYYQVYTGEQNENVYTHEFHGPYWGFRKVIQTFRLTDKPRRFKPVDIYYHFYSGSKRASLKALETVFDWAVKQPLFPIYTSEYVPKVLDFYDASLTKEGTCVDLAGMHDLRTVRLDRTDRFPDFQRSIGVIGYKNETDRTYVSFVKGAKKVRLCLREDEQNATSYLIDANAFITSDPKGWRLSGYAPIETTWHVPKTCTIEAEPKPIRRNESNETVTLHWNAKEVNIDVRCR